MSLDIDDQRGMPRVISLFIAFRVLFNARFYYPVMGVLFLDLGLTLEQFSLLNVVWAVTIVVAEVPSGALADVVGRKFMVVFAAALMVLEMAIFAFAPTGNTALLFGLLLVNRVLSGLAEASASGADEALAYDSLAAVGRAGEWPQVLARLMRWQGGAFFAAMLLGAAFYDANFMQQLLRWCSLDIALSASDTVRWPVYATLVTAVLALGTTLAMSEVSRPPRPTGSPLRAAWAQVASSAAWIGRTPRVVALLMVGLCIDSVVRLFMTLGSNYYRWIEIPPVWFGVAGAAMGGLGFFLPELAKFLIGRRSAGFNFALVGGLALFGLVGAAFGWKWWGLLFMMPLGVAMNLFSTFLSHYLNEAVDSSHRATVLSFRGLSLNLAYGAIGLGYAGLSLALAGANPGETFARTLFWLPVYLVVTGLLTCWVWRRLYRSPGDQT